MYVVLKFLNSFFRVIIFISLLETIVVNGSNLSLRNFADYFETEKFLFVGLSNCHLTTERNPPIRNCPYHITFRTRMHESSENCAGYKMHLWLSEGSRPLALVLFPSSQGYLESKVNELFWDNTSTPDIAFSAKKLDLRNSTKIGFDIKYDEVVFSLFDTDYRLLYVVSRNATIGRANLICSMFAASLVGSTVNFNLVAVYDVHPINGERILWSEDPYEKKFYYNTAKSQGLYSVPFNEIMLVLTTGFSGEFVMDLEGELVSVSRSIVISYSTDVGKIFHVIKNMNSRETKGIVCEEESTASELDGVFPLTLIFGKNYCALGDLNPSFNCSDVELSTVPAANIPPVDCKVSGVIYWLIGIIFVLTCFIIGITVRSWRSRNKMVDETFLKAESPKIHYYPTFVSDASPDF